jgi:hypothetical protein
LSNFLILEFSGPYNLSNFSVKPNYFGPAGVAPCSDILTFAEIIELLGSSVP